MKKFKFIYLSDWTNGSNRTSVIVEANSESEAQHKFLNEEPYKSLPCYGILKILRVE